MDELKKKKNKRVFRDMEEVDEETGVFEMIGNVSAWHLFKYVLLVAATCMFLHFVITVGHVAYSKYCDVKRYRQVAHDEMEQDCCKIFYSNKSLFGDTATAVVDPVPSTAIAVVKPAPTVKVTPEKIQSCQRILAEEKRQGKTNRCEASQDIIGHWMPYQVLLEVWKYYFPFADVSFTQYVLGGGMTFIANLLGGYVIRKVAF